MSKNYNIILHFPFRLTLTVSLLFGLILSAPAQDRSQWLTPVADIQFKGDKVVYCYQVCDPVYRLEPLFITSAYMAIPSMRNGSSIANDISKTRKWLNSEVKSLPAGNDISSKETFLKACALYIIWNMDHTMLPDEGLEQNITILTFDSNEAISHEAKLVIKLYMSVCRGLQEEKK
jgi:hypothetical protein